MTEIPRRVHPYSSRKTCNHSPFKVSRYSGKDEVMPEETVLIQPLPVERGAHGYWTHPAWPSTEDELIPYAWFDSRGLEVRELAFEYDASEEVQASLLAEGIADCAAWNPSNPPGEGWFIFSIHDTDDGPMCVWVRKRVTP